MDSIWKKISDVSDELIFICNADGVIQNANKKAMDMLEYSDEELKSILIDDLFLDKTVKFGEIAARAKEKYQILSSSIYRKNRTCFMVSVKVVYSKEDGCFIIICSDNTEIEKLKKDIEFAAERAKESEKVRNEFVANVTHELRTPVNGIKGHTQYLMLTEHTRDQGKELSIIKECCENMEQLINNILDFSKLEAGKFSISEREFVFKDFLEFISETNGKLIEDKGLRFVLNADPSIPEKLIGDDFRLTQVLNNLLSNAKKFTEKGYIAVEVTRTMQFDHDIELFFMVMDSGIGVKPEKKAALFESFVQADASITRSYGGTGLGLAITKQLVELMDGKINLESEYGKGSTFTFSVRLKIPEDVIVDEMTEIKTPLKLEHSKLAGKLREEINQLNLFGSVQNIYELRKIVEKLSLCLELDNYQRAEGFADTVKSLVADGPSDLKSLAFRMQMSIRKEDGENANRYLNDLCSRIMEETGKDVLNA